jgi:hypothetical protein
MLLGAKGNMILVRPARAQTAHVVVHSCRQFEKPCAKISHSIASAELRGQFEKEIAWMTLHSHSDPSHSITSLYNHSGVGKTRIHL